MKPVVLAILDGWALSEARDGNAIRQAQTPRLNELFRQFPHTSLACSGEAVGLLAGQMGDSNVGHLNIGAGRVVYQPLVRINRIIREGQLGSNPVVREMLGLASGPEKALHLVGLLSDGGVHSHIDHLLALLREAKAQDVKHVYVHAFLDGRDVPPRSALQYIDALEQSMAKIGVGRIATVMGRFYAMDRDQRWERVAEAYRAIVEGKGEYASSARQAVEASYLKDVSDEFVVPAIVDPAGTVKDGDVVFMWNFRADRARELLHALGDEEFLPFQRANKPDARLYGMTEYAQDLPVPFAVPPQDLSLTLGEVVSLAGLTQLRVAETEKYAHVTFFFNGGREEAFAGEHRILVPSPKVATYDQCPQMSAVEITDKLLPRLADYDMIVVNYANLDMVGHTGIMQAAICAVETVDTCVGRLADAVAKVGGALVLSADHGNAEQMVDPSTGSPHTAHTPNPVPCLVMAHGVERLNDGGILADLAPTVLQLLEVAKPAAMTGTSLIK